MKGLAESRSQVERLVLAYKVNPNQTEKYSFVTSVKPDVFSLSFRLWLVMLIGCDMNRSHLRVPYQSESHKVTLIFCRGAIKLYKCVTGATTNLI